MQTSVCPQCGHPNTSETRFVLPLTCACGYKFRKGDPNITGDAPPAEHKPRSERPPRKPRGLDPCLPGDAVHLVVKEKGHDITPGCGCKSMIRKMNKNPIEWSYEHIDEITAVMVKEMHRRKYVVPVLGITPPDIAAGFVAKKWIVEGLENCERAQLSVLRINAE